jgi:hypothetical protein
LVTTDCRAADAIHGFDALVLGLWPPGVVCVMLTDLRFLSLVREGWYDWNGA